MPIVKQTVISKLSYIKNTNIYRHKQITTIGKGPMNMKEHLGYCQEFTNLADNEFTHKITPMFSLLNQI